MGVNKALKKIHNAKAKKNILVLSVALIGLVLSACSSHSDETPAEKIQGGAHKVVHSKAVTKTINKTTEKTVTFLGVDNSN